MHILDHTIYITIICKQLFSIFYSLLDLWKLFFSEHIPQIMSDIIIKFFKCIVTDENPMIIGNKTCNNIIFCYVTYAVHCMVDHKGSVDFFALTYY